MINMETALIGAVVIAAAVSDLDCRKIPNVLTYPALLAGLVLGTVANGIGATSIGLLIAFVPALLLFCFATLGGGDVKLLAAVGAAVGYPVMLDVWVYTLLAAVIIGVFQMLMLGRLGEIFLGLKSTFLSFMYPGVPPVIPGKDVTMPFGLAIAVGTLAGLLSPASIARLIS